MIIRYVFSDQILRMKKVNALMMCVNKIVTAVINNDLKLIDLYAFVGHALAQFPAISNITEEKSFFPSYFKQT